MSSHLTYRPHEGIVFGVAAGPANPAGAPAQSVGHRPRGMADGLPARRSRRGLPELDAPGASIPFDLHDYPGEHAQRFDGVEPGGRQANHRHHAHVALVKSGWRQGFSIHGLPACGDPRCIVVVQEWDSLFTALEATRQVSIVVEL